MKKLASLFTDQRLTDLCPPMEDIFVLLAEVEVSIESKKLVVDIEVVDVDMAVDAIVVDRKSGAEVDITVLSNGVDVVIATSSSNVETDADAVVL